MSKAVIEIQNLTKDYQLGKITVPALRGVDLTIMQNEYMAIMGPSGSGKSTLMNIIGCLDVPTGGTYKIDNIDVSSLEDDDLSRIRSKKIGFVFQTFNLLQKIDALHNVELPLIYAGESKEKRHELATKALERVGLADRKHHKPNELSGGQRQRVAIARALVNSPEIILADEPTGNLDSKTGTEIMDIFDDLHKDGNTIIMVTHENDIAEYSNRIIQLFDGKIGTDVKNGKRKK